MWENKEDHFYSFELPDEEEAQKLNMEFGQVGEEDGKTKKDYWPLKLGAVVLAVFFIFVTLNSLLTYLAWPSLGFIQESQELEKNPYLQELQEAVVQVIALKESVPVDVQGRGTGFNLSPDGLILTNRHVIEGAEEVVVNFEGKGSLQVKDWYLPRDKNLDMAILVLEGEDLPFISIDEEASPEEGSEVYIIGNPLGFPGIINEGRIVHRLSDGENIKTPLVTIEAPIHQGSSGSPVFNKERKVIGIVYATASIEDKEDPLGIALSLENMEEIVFNGHLNNKRLPEFW